MKNHFLILTKWSLLLFCLLNVPQLFSQKTITGIVLDGSNNQSLIGGNVIVKGKSMGTVTNIEGKYSIVANPTDILVFTYIGMQKQEIIVGDKTVINLTIQPSSNQLFEVVAIGYGSVKKSDLTGSVSVISAKDLTKNPSSSAAQALQGKAPGVLVTQSGIPGGGASIRVRGVGSISKGADPIFILDGVQVDNINGIQPQDIENLQVLKDASASAIYGANGSNGVVIVNTKRGKSGKPQVNLNTYISAILSPKQYDVMNADEYSAFYSDIYKNIKKIDVPLEYGQSFRQKYYGDGWQQGTNWQSELFKTGFSKNYNLSVSGGGDDSNYNVSVAYNKDDGNVIKSNADRYNIRANSDFKLSKYIKVGENFSANYSTGESPIMVQTTVWDLNASPLMKVYNSFYKGGYESPQSPYYIDNKGNLINGNAPFGNNDPITYINTKGNDKVNPIAAPFQGSNKNYGLSTSASVYMQIDFSDWLSYKITPSAEINYSRTKFWLPAFTGNRSLGSATGGTAILQEGYYENIKLNLENQITFKKKFNDVHNVQATAVYQIRTIQANNIFGVANGFDFPQLNTLTNGGTASTSLNSSTSEYRMLSYLGRIMYDFKGKYFATASYRSDGVSLFAPSFRRGEFKSASLAWKLNEDFLQNVKEIDALKLRLGWGQTGNSSIGNGIVGNNTILDGYQYLDQIYNSTAFSPVFGNDQHIARAQYVFYGFGSKEIHWESAEMYNFGIDLNMFNGKIQASAEYYIKNNNDLLIQIPISSAFGRVDANPWFNTGKIQNRGIEFSLQWRDKIGEFNYGVITNFTTIKNEVKNLPVSDITTGNNRTIVGHSIGALYGYVSEGIIQLDASNYATDEAGNWIQEKNQQGLWSGNYLGYKHATYLNGKTPPQPGDIKYADLTGDGNINDLDKSIIGKTIPSFTYTVGFDCSYKNFDFNIFLFGVNSFDIYNNQRATLSSIVNQDMDHNKLNDFAQNHWTLENASTTHVRVDLSNSNSNDQISSFWIEDGSFLRIKDVQFGYTLPKNYRTRLGVSSVRVYANASNLYCLTAYTGRDPEGLMSVDPLNSGTDSGNYTVPRSFTFSLQIGF